MKRWSLVLALSSGLGTTMFLAHCSSAAPIATPVVDAGPGPDTGPTTCTPPRVACGARCVDANDPTACGASCTACIAPPNATATCKDGACGFACAPGAVKCGAGCVEVANDANHCGRCGRACGAGSSCSQGRCAPAPIRASVTSPTGIAIAGNDALIVEGASITRCNKVACASPTVFANPGATGGGIAGRTIRADATFAYWGGSDGTSSATVFRQGLTGGNATGLAEGGGVFGAQALAVEGNDVFFANAYGVFGCSAATPPCTAPQLASAAQLEALGLDATYLVWSDFTGLGGGTSGVFRCERASCAATRGFLVTDMALDGGPGAALHPASLSVFGGKVYWADIDTTTSDKARVLACAVTGCGGQPTVLAKGEDSVTAVAADASGVYFTVGGSASAATGAVKVCRNPSGCGAASETLAAGQATPVALALDADAVYWLNAGVSGSGGAALRVVK